MLATLMLRVRRRARPIPGHSPGAHCPTLTPAVPVRVEPAAPRLLPLFHLATLGLVLSNKLISFPIGRGAGRDGSLFLLSGFTKHGTETLDLKLEFATVVVVLGDRLGDLIVALLELLEFTTGLKQKVISKVQVKSGNDQTLTWSRASVVVRISA